VSGDWSVLRGTLEENVAAFGAYLRAELGFRAGPGESIDALRALETVGIAERTRVRNALRLVFCAKAEEVAAFDRAFDDFFTAAPRGMPQDRYTPRLTRPAAKDAARERIVGDGDDGDSDATSGVRTDETHASEAVESGVLRARASRHAARGEVPVVVLDDAAQALDAAGALLRRLRLGRTRRWHRVAKGRRMDFRRTIRASLQTGGEPFDQRWLGHPQRNPRVVVVIDGSRSIGSLGDPMLRFAWALTKRSGRVDVFVFSTTLHDITKMLRGNVAGGALTLGSVAEAWGGGTRIGESLWSLVRDHGHRVLSRDSAVIVFSDGLDVGEPQQLRAAMRELRRRTAGIVWLNPLAAHERYAPTAGGMRAALPFVDVFAPGDAQGLIDLPFDSRLRAVFGRSTA